jgi:hypothetical protein
VQSAHGARSLAASAGVADANVADSPTPPAWLVSNLGASSYMSSFGASIDALQAIEEPPMHGYQMALNAFDVMTDAAMPGAWSAGSSHQMQAAVPMYAADVHFAPAGRSGNQTDQHAQAANYAPRMAFMQHARSQAATSRCPPVPVGGAHRWHSQTAPPALHPSMPQLPPPHRQMQQGLWGGAPAPHRHDFEHALSVMPRGGSASGQEVPYASPQSWQQWQQLMQYRGFPPDGSGAIHGAHSSGPVPGWGRSMSHSFDWSNAGMLPPAQTHGGEGPRTDAQAFMPVAYPQPLRAASAAWQSPDAVSTHSDMPGQPRALSNAPHQHNMSLQQQPSMSQQHMLQQQHVMQQVSQTRPPLYQQPPQQQLPQQQPLQQQQQPPPQQ